MIDTLIGKKYNMLTVLKRVDNKKVGEANVKFYLCKCDCGNYTVVRAEFLKNGHTKSCGCQVGLKKERVFIPREVDEDGTRTIAIRLWRDLKLACYSKGHPLYNGYSLCDEWRDFDVFYEWFLSFNIKEPCRIVLKVQNKKYTPKNCYLIRKKGIDAKLLPRIYEGEE